MVIIGGRCSKRLAEAGELMAASGRCRRIDDHGRKRLENWRSLLGESAALSVVAGGPGNEEN
jgi:hypothetical protein